MLFMASACVAHAPNHRHGAPNLSASRNYFREKALILRLSSRSSDFMGCINFGIKDYVPVGRAAGAVVEGDAMLDRVQRAITKLTLQARLRKALRGRNVSIISSNCIGGRLSQIAGEPYRSRRLAYGSGPTTS